MSKFSPQDRKLGTNLICVALIDDHDLSRVGIRTALQRSGKVRVVGEATNAIDGLKLLKQTCPDVAIIDIGLPGTSGIELTRKFRQELRQANREPKTKVMMLTLHDDEAAVLSAFVAGADSYCMKDSVNSHTLLKVLQDTYEGRNWIDPQIARVLLKQSPSRQLQSEPAKMTTVTINKISLDQKQLLEAEPLTSRQLEILELVVAGYSNKEIAKQLHITLGTAKTHVRDILRKLCADDRTQAAVRALRAGLIS